MFDRSAIEVGRYYDDFSRSYELARGGPYHRMIDDLEVATVAPFAKGARVLELGCGTGLILRRVAELAREVVGIDISEGMAARAVERGLEVRVGDVCSMPFADDCFDVVYGFKVLAHVENILGALEEAARVTRPGGHLLLEFYNPWSFRYLAKKVAGPRPISAQRTEADVYTRWDTPRRVRKLLPASMEFVDYRGIRVFTPFAAAHSMPGLAQLLRRVESYAVRSTTRYFGGFLVAVARKRSELPVRV